MSDPNDMGGLSSKQQQQNPFAPKEAEVCRPEPQGRLGDVWPISIPEQVVGSTHEFEFPAPRNTSPLGAVAVATMDGSSELSVDSFLPTTVPGMGSGPLRIRYTPTSVGAKHSTLTLVMRWEDGHVEKRTIEVTARARKLEDVPASEARSAPAKGPKPPVESKAPDRPLMVDASNTWKNVDRAFGQLIVEQKQGITDVTTEAAKFKPKPAPRSIWEDIAELAFSIGTGAIGGLVANFVASKVASFLVNAKPFAEAAEEGGKDIAAAEKAAVAARGDAVDEHVANQNVIAKKVGNYAREDGARHREVAQDKLGETLGGALEKVFDKAVEEAKGEKSEGGESEEASQDKEIAFFSDQQSMVNAFEVSAGNRLDSHVAETLKAHPDIADDVMKGVVAGLGEAAHEAKKKQALATSSQFMTYLARTNLGTEQIKTAQGPETVTDMTEQRGRGHSKLEASKLASGVLEIECDYQRGGDVRVVDARVHNISYLVANRLLDQYLAHSGVPIRVSLWGGLTTITRDEAGRVRVGGGILDLSGGPMSEQQDIQEAERILHIVLSKPLKQWGVAQIHSNDATQPEDPKKKEGEKA